MNRRRLLTQKKIGEKRKNIGEKFSLGIATMYIIFFIKEINDNLQLFTKKIEQFNIEGKKFGALVYNGPHLFTL